MLVEILKTFLWNIKKSFKHLIDYRTCYILIPFFHFSRFYFHFTRIFVFVAVVAIIEQSSRKLENVSWWKKIEIKRRRKIENWKVEEALKSMKKKCRTLLPTSAQTLLFIWEFFFRCGFLSSWWKIVCDWKDFWCYFDCLGGQEVNFGCV